MHMSNTGMKSSFLPPPSLLSLFFFISLFHICLFHSSLVFPFHLSSCVHFLLEGNHGKLIWYVFDALIAYQLQLAPCSMHYCNYNSIFSLHFHLAVHIIIPIRFHY